MSEVSEHSEYPAVRLIGEDGYLIEFAGGITDRANRAALAFRSRIDTEKLAGAIETASALKSVYYRFDPEICSHEETHARLLSLLDEQDWEQAELPVGRKLWRIPAVLGGENGPQLGEIADLAGLREDETIEAFCAQPLRVLAMGFAPGMPYLGLLPETWDIPRQSTLTPQVPEGALCVAIRQVVAFTIAAQTGWRQIGQGAFQAFDPERDPVFLFRPGDELVFEPVKSEEFARFQSGDLAPPDAVSCS